MTSDVDPDTRHAAYGLFIELTVGLLPSLDAPITSFEIAENVGRVALTLEQAQRLLPVGEGEQLVMRLRTALDDVRAGRHDVARVQLGEIAAAAARIAGVAYEQDPMPGGDTGPTGN